MTTNGQLARTPHPPALGSPLTHPHITTDFSEAQLEFITGVHDSAGKALHELADIHRFVCANIGDERLWAASMPCVVGAEENIPVARFGTSNVGRSKTVYRIGLAHRYGRLMQIISGIHYNFSLPETLWPAIAEAWGEASDEDFATRAYFGLIRNFRRYSWLLVYLFGASPAVCRSFAPGISAGLDALDAGTLYLPHATSLRMGRLGYQSAAQSSLHISYNSLDEYAATMREALTEPYLPYEAIGTKVDGEYRQLSTALLQIENEFYGTIRPKRRVRSSERPLDALRDRGVEYVEVRCLDLDPLLPLGIDVATCRFMDVFLLACLFDESEQDSQRESETMLVNQLDTVERGRQPNLVLRSNAGPVPLSVWAGAILERCHRVAWEIDAVAGEGGHVDAVALQRRKLQDPNRTPSARVLSALRRQGVPFAEFVLRQSSAHRAWCEQRPLPAARFNELAAMSGASLRQQARLEDADRDAFDTYLERYLQLGAGDEAVGCADCATGAQSGA